MKRAKRGIACAVKLRAESAEVGVRVLAAPRKALRLDLSIQQPDRIHALVIVGFDAQGTPQLHWDWDLDAAVPGSERFLQVTLLPGEWAGYFRPILNGDPSAVTEVEVFARVRGMSTDAGFTIHRLATAD